MTITWLSPLKTFDSRETPQRNLPPRNNNVKMSERDIQDVRWPPLARMADSRAAVLTSEYFQFQHQWKWFELHLERCQQLKCPAPSASQFPDMINFPPLTSPARMRSRPQHLPNISVNSTTDNSTYLLSDSFSSTASSDRLPKTQISGNGDNLLNKFTTNLSTTTTSKISVSKFILILNISPECSALFF